ncbi:MAG: ribonuclease R [Pirellulales bacterium]|nr:ribonuclease R [Pirellulales bacterium]
MPEEIELDEAVLRHVRRPNYKPVKPRVIAKKLGLSKDQTSQLKMSIKRLVRAGQLVYGVSHLVKPVTSAKPAGNQIVGIFRRNDKGFGFVRPTSPSVASAAGGPSKPSSAEIAEAKDVYIPAKRAGDAATGDMVRVELVGPSRRQPDRGPKGHIVEILQRQTYQFVGTYFELRGAGYVRVDGPMFAEPILVGDPGAKNVRPDDKVVIEMVRFPSEFREGEGVVTEVLGPLGEPGVDTLSIIREFELPDEFPQNVLDQAHQAAAAFDEKAVPPDRTDLTDRTIITIDPADARDFDDAISLERSANGHWLLGVHIADVAHFVPVDTALDREARNRGTSVYLPDRVIPMLPETISNSVASLQPDRVRLVKTALIEFTAEGQRVATDFCSAAIRSTKRLNYDQVDQFLADPEAPLEEFGPDVHQLLGRMHELAMILRRRRFEKGALELIMPEVKIHLDGEGKVSGADAVEYTESHQIIEEFMLAANEAVAERLADQEIFFLRRIHASASPRRLKELTEFVNQLGFKTESLESRFELQRVLNAVAGCPEQHAVHFAVLRSMQRAVYGPQEEGHYALASKCYCHFTSPIRRYPDLTVHRLLGELLEGRKPRNDFAELAVLGEHCSDRERRAEAAERELVKVKLLGYLKERIGEEMDTVITGVERFGLFVQGIKLPAEGLIHIDSLTDDHYDFDRAAHMLSGRKAGNTFRLGDRVRVAVARVDLEDRKLDFRLVARSARRLSEKRRSRPKSTVKLPRRPKKR